MNSRRTRIGVLALQGSFSEHVTSLRRLDVDPVEVRMPHHLKTIDGIIIPGGESTTILKLLDEYELRAPLTEMLLCGLPALGTCAGVNCLATKISTHRMKPLGIIDITVARNAFGRQIESFEQDLVIEGLEGPPFRGVFIRAPVIESCGPGVRVLSRLSDGTIVACSQGNVIVTSFHPEFVDDLRVHDRFKHVVETHAAGSFAAASGEQSAGRGR